jgi:hypothetical protein
MKVTNIQSRTVKTYTVTIDDGEVRNQPYSRAGRRYRVERITVEKRDGNVGGVELQGSVLKKDGTPGENDARERFYSQSDWPEWLNRIVGGLS